MDDMMTDSLFRGYRTVVASEWIDVNDHMNARFYASVIYDAHVMFTTHLGRRRWQRGSETGGWAASLPSFIAVA